MLTVQQSCYSPSRTETATLQVPWPRLRRGQGGDSASRTRTQMALQPPVHGAHSRQVPWTHRLSATGSTAAPGPGFLPHPVVLSPTSPGALGPRPPPTVQSKPNDWHPCPLAPSAVQKALTARQTARAPFPGPRWPQPTGLGAGSQGRAGPANPATGQQERLEARSLGRLLGALRGELESAHWLVCEMQGLGCPQTSFEWTE